MMAISKAAVILGAAALLASCATDPYTGEQRITRPATGALIGSGAGALLGALIGGRNNRAETIIGAGIGAIAGASIGHYMDRQEQKLREQTANTGIEVERQGDDILLKMPSNVTFDFNSAVLKPEFRPELQQVAETLVEFPSTFVDVMGHTDNIGSATVNQRLSEQRAQSVAAALTAYGVQSARIATRGYGYNVPVDSNDTEEGRARNRRVEIRLSPVTPADVQGTNG